MKFVTLFERRIKKASVMSREQVLCNFIENDCTFVDIFKHKWAMNTNIEWQYHLFLAITLLQVNNCLTLKSKCAQDERTVIPKIILPIMFDINKQTTDNETI